MGGGGWWVYRAKAVTASATAIYPCPGLLLLTPELKVATVVMKLSPRLLGSFRKTNVFNYETYSKMD